MRKDGGRFLRLSWQTGSLKAVGEDFLLGLKERGFYGVEFVGPQTIILGLSVQYGRFCRKRFGNAVMFISCEMPGPPARKANDDCLQELRWIYDRCDLSEAQKDLANGWIAGRKNIRSCAHGPKKT